MCKTEKNTGEKVRKYYQLFLKKVLKYGNLCVIMYLGVRMYNS